MRLGRLSIDCRHPRFGFAFDAIALQISLGWVTALRNAVTRRDGVEDHRLPVGTARIRPLPVMARQRRPSIIPLSSAQQHWTTPKQAPLSDNRIPLVVRFEGRLNIRALERALSDVVDRHEVLRTHYLYDGIAFRQEIRRQGCFILRHRSVASLPIDKRIEAVWEQLNAEFLTPAQLDADVLGLTLFELDKNDHLLGGFVHHIAFDAVSVRTFWSNVFNAYKSRTLGLGTPSPPELQYADFAIWENDWLAQEGTANVAEFWRSHFSSVATLTVPEARKLSVTPAPLGTTPFKLPTENFERAREFARRRRTTLNPIFLSAFLSVLSVREGVELVPSSFIIQARPPRFNRLIGCFMQFRAMRLDLHGNPNFDELVVRTRAELFETSDLRRPLPDRLSNDLELGQALVNYSMGHYEGGSTQTISMLGLTVRGFQFPRDFKTHVTRNIQFAVTQRPNQLEGQIIYAKDAFDEASAQRFGENVVAFIAKGIDAPESRFSDLVRQR